MLYGPERLRLAHRLAMSGCIAASVVVLAACSNGEQVTAQRQELDTRTPWPINAGGFGPDAPTTYKGLPLQLIERASPTVTAVDGWIGVVCVGMSNANQECSRLIAATDPGGPWNAELSPAVRLVNCAVGGHAIERWNDPAYDAVLWRDCIERKIPARGLRPNQVRVVLHKAANQFGLGPGGIALPHYPDPASNFAAFYRNLGSFAARIKVQFPSVQAVYTSSRTFGGFTARPERGEPQSYEEGHALNQWLAQHARLDDVWYGWWGYLWAPACGQGASSALGVCFDRSDFVDDAVHPTPAGEIKLARIQHDRLRREAWYRR